MKRREGMRRKDLRLSDKCTVCIELDAVLLVHAHRNFHGRSIREKEVLMRQDEGSAIVDGYRGRENRGSK